MAFVCFVKAICTVWDSIHMSRAHFGRRSPLCISILILSKRVAASLSQNSAGGCRNFQWGMWIWWIMHYSNAISFVLLFNQVYAKNPNSKAFMSKINVFCWPLEKMTFFFYSIFFYKNWTGLLTTLFLLSFTQELKLLSKKSIKQNLFKIAWQFFWVLKQYCRTMDTGVMRSATVTSEQSSYLKEIHR